MMNGDGFAMRAGRLTCDGVSLEAVARGVGTPYYVYSARRFLRNFREFDAAFRGYPHLICYAMKTNSNLAVCRLLARAGAGADIVSGGELSRALRAGFPPRRIVFAGVGKTAEEIAAAVKAGILMFNVESLPELRAIDRVAGRLGRVARVAFRVNPDINPRTHPHIATGLAHSKFGIPHRLVVPAYREASRLRHVEVLGIQMHIGSQITSVAPYVAALRRLLRELEALGKCGIRIQVLDVGGGLGIRYRAESPVRPADLARAILPLLPRGPRARKMVLLLEPGRFISGNAGALVTRVLYYKNSAPRACVVVDTGMHHLIRPALYDAWHEVLPVRAAPSRGRITADVVGPICETGDVLARRRRLPWPEAGDLYAIMNAGAYGFAMSSNYNSFSRPPEVLVINGRARVVRERERPADLWRGERIPAELNAPPAGAAAPPAGAGGIA